MRAFRSAMTGALMACLFSGMLIATAPAASASYPTSYQANILGWCNCSFGNYGNLAPANNLLDVISAYMSYGYDPPGSVTTNETCFAFWYGNPSNQFSALFAPLAYISGNTYSWAFAESEPTGPDPTYCGLAGEGIIARANSASAEWQGDRRVVLHSPDGTDPHTRVMGCDFPTFVIWNFSICTTHTSTQPTLATSEAGTAYYLFGLVGNPRRIQGDFNLTGLNPPSGSTSLNASRLPTSPYRHNPAASPSNEIDYIFEQGFSITSTYGSTIAPQYCSTYGADCTGLNNNYISDHYWVVGFG
jgi:hypothetical protein